MSHNSASDKLTIVRSEAKSWYKDGFSSEYAPDKAYDGDVSTWYSVKDGDAAGNFLKLYLSEIFSIGGVILTNRGYCCYNRIIGTAVMVYSTTGEDETKISGCGEEITGNT